MTNLLYSGETPIGNEIVVLEVKHISADRIEFVPVSDGFQQKGVGHIALELGNKEFARGWEVGDVIEFELLRRIRPGSGTVQRRRS